MNMSTSGLCSLNNGTEIQGYNASHRKLICIWSAITRNNLRDISYCNGASHNKIVPNFLW